MQLTDAGGQAIPAFAFSDSSPLSPAGIEYYTIKAEDSLLELGHLGADLTKIAGKLLSYFP